MRVHLRFFTNLVGPETCDYRESTLYNLNNGTTVKDLVYEAGIDENVIKVAFDNSKVVNLETPLSDGDREGLVPAVGGM